MSLLLNHGPFGGELQISGILSFGIQQSTGNVYRPGRKDQIQEIMACMFQLGILLTLIVLDCYKQAAATQTILILKTP